MPAETGLTSLNDALQLQGEWAEKGTPGITLFDIALTLAKAETFILSLALAGGFITALVVLRMPPMFTATAVIMPPQQQQSATSAFLGQLGPLAGLAERDLGLRNPTELYLGILGGRTIADDLIETFKLQDVYNQKSRADTRKMLMGRSNFSSARGSLIEISVEDHDPRRAATLANAYVEQLHRLTNQLALTEAAQRRIFFQGQLENENKALSDAELAMESTQERTGVLQVNAQVETLIRSMAQLRAEIVSREVALSSLKRGATSLNPEVVRQETELTALRQELEKLETRAGSASPKDSTMLPISDVPKAGLAYVRALRDVKYHEALFELTSKQFEAARIDESRETPLIQVVDRAVPPERKSWPPRAFLTLGGAAVSGLFACLIVLAGSRLRNPLTKEKLHLLKDALARRRRTA
ncbi:MAG TPA: Wzz/FepE/Etk N-terminal domain-containing protein [Bryobacteraceae bacterium]|jgi:uncharacterized protein involved in exopolysaccharide biosynthesis